jgi:hypothetical protein
MHSHDHDHLDAEVSEPLRTREDRPKAHHLEAAAQGRADVLGPGGLLGIQRAVGNAAAAGIVEEEQSPVHQVISSGGTSLDEGVRTDMEDRMGHDFSDVRVHTGDAADNSARSVSAHAYTVGSNIVFQRGAYDPGSAAGQTLLAHELTHVVQQRTGPVDGTPAAGGVSVSDPSDRFEREAASNAEHVMAQPAHAVQRHEETEEVQASHDPSLPAVQRQEEEETEEIQTAHDPSLPAVQRQEEEEAEEEQA